MPEEWTPCQIAVEQQDVVRLAAEIGKGADVNQVDPRDGWSLLHHAVDVEIDASVQTGLPLRVAITRLLLEHGADATMQNYDGETALDMAEQRDHYLAVELLRTWIDQRP